MRDLEAVVETPEHDMVGARDRQGIRTWLLVAVASRTSSHRAVIGLALDKKSCQERERSKRPTRASRPGLTCLFLSMIPATERPARGLRRGENSVVTLHLLHNLFPIARLGFASDKQNGNRRPRGSQMRGTDASAR